MLIGIDIDDTLANTSETLLQYALEYDKKLRGKGILKNNGHNVYGRFDWSKNEYSQFYSKYNKLAFENAKVFPHAKEVIENLRQQGYEFAIISSRSKDKRILTYEWFEKNNLEFEKVLFISKYKGYAALALGASYFMDDNPYNCEDTNQMDIITFIFTSEKNKDYYHKNIDRINDWSELYDRIGNSKINEKIKTLYR